MSCTAAMSLCFSAVPGTSKGQQGAGNYNYLEKVFSMLWVGFHENLLVRPSCRGKSELGHSAVMQRSRTSPLTKAVIAPAQGGCNIKGNT